MKIALAIAALLALAGAVYFFARPGGVSGGATGNAPAPDYVVRVKVVPIWAGPGPMPSNWGSIPALRGTHKDVLLSAISARFGGRVRVEGGKVFVVAQSRGTQLPEGPPIIRRSVRPAAAPGFYVSTDSLEVATGTGIAQALTVAVVIGTAVASAVGGPGAGAAVAAGGGALVAAAS